MGYYDKKSKMNKIKYQVKLDTALKSKPINLNNLNEKSGKCIELFAGKGFLTEEYEEMFNEVVTVDEANYDNVQYNMTAETFIRTELSNHLNFNLIDFDDEGCPGEEIKLFFETIKGTDKDSFVLSITDGAANRLPDISYSKISKYPSSDHDRFCKLVKNFVEVSCQTNGFSCKELFNKRSDQGTAVYASYIIERS